MAIHDGKFKRDHTGYFIGMDLFPPSQESCTCGVSCIHNIEFSHLCRAVTSEGYNVLLQEMIIYYFFQHGFQSCEVPDGVNLRRQYARDTLLYTRQVCFQWGLIHRYFVLLLSLFLKCFQ